MTPPLYTELEEEKIVFYDHIEDSDFRKRLLFSWVYHEQGLEGEAFGEDEFEAALAGEEAEYHAEQKRYDQVHQLHSMADELLWPAEERSDVVDVDAIRSMHETFCEPFEEARAGLYRKRDTSPGVYYLDVVPATSVSYHFRKLVDEMSDEIGLKHPVEWAAEFHWEFMRVFPFDERTGMVGRLVMNHFLLQNEYPPAVIHTQQRDDYFQALEDDAEALLPVIVEGIRNTIDGAREFE